MALESQATQSSRPIITLPREVVDKIAAGEVVLRPLNAVKELIENSLDAGATEITVTCKNGGLDLIKVKDNGCGIDRADYERVCERFATSKLRTVADLRHMSTFGFRGEALASISCMAKVQVVSRTKDSPHAWIASYKNCKPCAPPSASAGLVGTQIIATNLYEEYPQRRAAFTRPNEQAVGIAEVLIKYAINFPHVKIAYVRDDGANRSGGSFCSSGNGDQHAVIRLLMSSNLTKDLFNFEVADEKLKFSADVCMANPLASQTSTAIKAKNQRQKIFQLFINNRLVSSNKLKQAVDRTFSKFDAFCPFIHIDMKVDPNRIDVNISPTKEQVCFEDESKIIDRIETKLFDIMQNFREHGIIELNKINSSTTITSTPNLSHRPVVLYEYPSTSKTPEISPIKSVNLTASSFGQKRKLNKDSSLDSIDCDFNVTPLNKVPKKSDSTGKKSSYVPSMAAAFSRILAAPNAMVRVDSRNRSMNEYLTPNSTFNSENRNSLPPGEISFYEKIHDETILDAAMLSENDTERSLDLTLNDMPDYQKYACQALDNVKNEASTYLTGLARKFVFVGFVDVTRAIFQSDNSIYLVEFIPLLEEMFYQNCLRSIGNLSGRRLVLKTEVFQDGMPMVSLVDTHLSICPKARLPNESKFEDKNHAVDELVLKLGKPENMRRLNDEFGIFVTLNSENGPMLKTILTQVDQYAPLLSQQLAQFGFDLVCVDWDMPDIATQQIARAIARLNAPRQIGGCSENEAREQCETIKCHVFGMLKTDYLVPEKLLSCVVRLLSTLDAYKIFGRC